MRRFLGVLLSFYSLSSLQFLSLLFLFPSSSFFYTTLAPNPSFLSFSTYQCESIRNVSIDTYLKIKLRTPISITDRKSGQFSNRKEEVYSKQYLQRSPMIWWDSFILFILALLVMHHCCVLNLVLFFHKNSSCWSLLVVILSFWTAY